MIHGTQAALQWGERELTVIDAISGEQEGIAVPWEDESTVMWQEVVEVVPLGKSGRYAPAKAVADIALMDAIHESLTSNARVVIVP